MTSVTFPSLLGGDGSTVSDDSNATTGLGNGGHRYRFLSSLVNLVAMAQTAVNAANTAVTSPASLTATSTTSLAIGTGSKSLTLAQTGKGFNVGGYVMIAATAAPAAYMYGQITAFTPATGAMTVNVLSVNSSGTLAAWTISAAQPNFALYSPSTGALSVYFDGNNLAIGGTTSAWGAGTEAIDFGGNGSIANLSTNDFNIGRNTYYNGTNWIAKATGVATRYQQSAGTHTWYGAVSVSAGAVQTFVQQWQLDASGNGTLAGALNTASTVSLASAATVAIGAAASNNITVTGTTTITAFDTVAAGIRRSLTFGGALTLTHNATTLILPGAANISTAAGDVAEMQSLGGGNWKCVNYMRVAGLPVTQTGDTMKGALNFAAAVSVASSATTDIGAAASNNVTITGTTTITSLGTANSGIRRTVVFSGALTLTHNSTTLILPGTANITTAVNDSAEFMSLGGGNWICIDYKKADGTPLAIGNATVTPVKLSQPFTQGTAVATTSGTAIDFTSIPSWVKRITMSFAGVSTNGGSNLLLQFGSASGGIETTGYVCSGSYGTSAVNATTGIALSTINAASYVWWGAVVLTNISGNSWEATCTTANASLSSTSAGGKTVSATLDRIRLTTVNGTDTFDAGSVNILYE